MACPKRSAVAGLPDDPLVEILSRVPVKDLHRSKCVSKGWRDLIADPLHRKKLPQTLEGFFYGCDGVAYLDDEYSSDRVRFLYGDDSDSYGDDDDIVSDVDDKNRSRHHRGYGHFINMSGRSPPLVDPSFPFLEEVPSTHTIRLLDSCNGLLLFEHLSWYPLGFIVCNPTTEQWTAVRSDRTLPDPLGNRRAFLVFDPTVSSHFHLVIFWFQEEENEESSDDEENAATVHAYSSETGVWNHSDTDWTVEEQIGQWEAWPRQSGIPISPTGAAAVVNGMLYLNLDELCIAEVDVEGKKRRIIPRPPGVGSLDPDHMCSLGQSQGCLHCITEEWGVHISPELYSRVNIGDFDEGDGDDFPVGVLSIWVLEDYDTQEWVLKHSVSFLHLFGKMFCEAGTDYDVVAIHPDGDLVFIVQHWNRQVISYGLKSNEVRDLGTLEHDYRCFTPYIPYFLDFLSN